MRKKHILSCGVLFSLLGFSKFSDFEIRAMQEPSIEMEVVASAIEEEVEYENIDPYYLRSLHFAEVFLPLEEKHVRNKVRKHLDEFSYDQQQSYHIHDLAVTTFPQVEKILAQYGVPSDFKYVPMLESRFTKHVTSPKGASGYWQFMPATARAFGLTVNDTIDERHDLIKSSHAAAKYLKALYREFGDWALVAAAYNVGSGNLKKAIQGQGETNYFKLDLNRETSSYVYQLIALKEIVEHPKLHGYTHKKALLAQKAQTEYAEQSRISQLSDAVERSERNAQPRRF